jgi:acyl carrier protein
MSVFETVVSVLQGIMSETYDLQLGTNLYEDLDLSTEEIVDVMLTIEQTIGVALDTHMFTYFETIGDICTYIEGKVS